MINSSRSSYPTLNLSPALRSRLSEETHNLFKVIGEMGEQRSYGIYLVGGFVRDFLLGFKNSDIDVVVEGDGIDFAKALSTRLGGRVLLHEKFATAIVTLADGLSIDVATARTEFYEYPAALPTVEASSIRHDLYRRDFTINTMAVKLNPENFGDLNDFYGGKKDLDQGIIRVLHNFSFIEDPTRVFRAIRYESRYNFRLEEGTADLIRNAVDLGLIDRLSGVRIANELVAILSEDHPRRAVERMAELKVLSLIHNDIKPNQDTYRLMERILEAEEWFRATFPDEATQRWVALFMAIFCQGLDSHQLDELSARLELNKAVRENVLAGAVDRIDFLPTLKDKPNSTVYRLLKSTRTEAVLFYLALAEDVSTRDRIKDFLFNLRLVSREIKGDDLIAAGYPVGPAIKDLLNIVLDAKLDGKVKGKKEELAFAQESFNKLYK